MTGIDGFLALEHHDGEVLNNRGRDVGEKGLQAEHPDETPLKRGPGAAGYHHPEFLGGASGVCDPYHLRFLRRPGQGQEPLLAYWHIAIGVAQHPLVCQGAERMRPEGVINPHEALQIGVITA